MGAPVVHFEINARDGRRLQDFYAQLFDWEIDANNPMGYGLVRTNAGKGIDGGIGTADDDAAEWVTVYVEVPDLQAALDKATALGATTVMPPTDLPGMVSLALFKDPAGHTVGLVAADVPPAAE